MHVHIGGVWDTMSCDTTGKWIPQEKKRQKVQIRKGLPATRCVFLEAAHTLNISLMKAEKFNLRNWVSVKIIRINTAERVALCLRAGHYVKANYMLSGAEAASAAPALAQLYIFIMLVSKCQTVLWMHRPHLGSSFTKQKSRAVFTQLQSTRSCLK